MLSMILSVSNLPSGYYKAQLSSRVSDPLEATVAVVAKEGMAGDWAAYIGWPKLEELKPQFQGSAENQYYCSRIHTTDQVAELGDKLSEDEARQLFSQEAFKRLRYRR